MKWLKNLFENNESPARTPYLKEYKGFSDFFLNAPNKEKIVVFTEAARRANEDQRNTIEKARVLVAD